MHKSNHNDLFLFGTFKGTVDFNPTGSPLFYSAGGTHDGYLVYLDSNYNIVNALSYACNNNFSARAISSDTCGNVYLFGIFTGQVDFDPSNATLLLSSNNSLYDIFFEKLHIYNCQITSVSETSSSQFNIYPNPTKDYFKFDIGNSKVVNSISILQVNGKIVFTYSNVKNSDYHAVPDVSPGIYIVKAELSDGTFMYSRIVLE